MRKKLLILAVFLIVLLFLIPLFSIFLDTEENRILKIFVASSLVLPMDSVEEAFEEAYPNVDVQVEGHGSIQVIRHVTELEEEVDLLMVADYSLIPTMAYNKKMVDSHDSYADWYIRFAGNSIVLAYTDNSRYANEVNIENWCEILSHSDVRFGFPDPLIDALGYRTPMIIQLAENYYEDENIFDDLVTVNFDPGFFAVDMDDKTVIVVPELLNPNVEKIALRASSVQLVPLLESGGIDYCFLYRSNAEQYGVKYIELPSEINLSSPEYEDCYEQVQIRFEHQRFGSVGLTRDGKTIYYGLTIPNNAPNPDLAISMIEFLLAGEGKKIFSELQHPVYEPAFTDNMDALPPDIAALVENDAYD